METPEDAQAPTMHRIRTYSGIYINPFDVKPEDIVLQDIAIALGRINRFGGHCFYPYTVAEHSYNTSVRVRDMCQDRGIDPEGPTKLALMHDAAEYLLGDVPTPIKRHPSMQGYRDGEAHVEKVIAERFQLDVDSWPLVIEADEIEKGIDLSYRRYNGPYLDFASAGQLWYNSALQLGFS